MIVDEIAVRFSHRVVAIHPYPNGNGRFSRLIADLLAIQLGQPRFTWGRVNLVDPGATRTAMRAQAFPGENPQSLKPPGAVADIFVELALPDCMRNGDIVRAD